MRRARIAMTVLLALAGAACSREGSPGIVQCGADPTLGAPGKEASWGPDALLFLLHPDGTLDLGSFRGGDWKVVGEHRFGPMRAHAVLSFDERWLVVEGSRGGEHEIWLHDTASGKGRLLLRRPGKGEALPHFSPDGRTLAVYANFDFEAPDDEVSGLFLFDPERGTRMRVPYPESMAADPRAALTTMRWSANGDSVYVFMLPIHAKEDARIVYRVSMVDRRFVQVDGRYDGLNDELLVAGQHVPFSGRKFMPSRYSFKELDSADGSFRAYVDPASLALRVARAGQGERHVATGREGKCGSTIAINGWVDHFLVFELDAAPYLYDAEGDRSRRIGRPGDEYFWFSNGAGAQDGAGTGSARR